MIFSDISMGVYYVLTVLPSHDHGATFSGGQLITGQNPSSSGPAAKLLIDYTKVAFDPPFDRRL